MQRCEDYRPPDDNGIVKQPKKHVNFSLLSGGRIEDEFNISTWIETCKGPYPKSSPLRRYLCGYHVVYDIMAD
jgi:hypothetical protein